VANGNFVSMNEPFSAKETWARALGELQLQVNRINYDTWLRDSVGMNYETDVFVVSVPNTFIAECLTKRFYSLIKKTLTIILGKNLGVQFVVQQPTLPRVKPLQSDGGVSTKIKTYQFNPKYTFTRFVVGECNRLAYAAATEVSEKPSLVYNPLIIHGDTGQGKTHLLHAIGHAAIERGLNVVYSSADQFTNEFVLAVKQNDVDHFRSKFTPVNIFLFDDFQLLNNKRQTQQFFFHTLNELYHNNCQIVIAADRAPKEMSLISSRLRSHLECGLVTQIHPLDFETRLAILQAKSREKKLPIIEETLRFIAQKIQDNVYQLEGALTYLDAYTKLTGLSLTPQIITKLLTPNKSIDDCKLIVQTVADYFDCPLDQLLGRKRDRETSLARQIAAYLLREEGNYSFVEISKVLGNRNHATILYGYKKITSELSVNSKLKRQINEIKQKIDNFY
jgi:chromosomal replication initiator protein